MARVTDMKTSLPAPAEQNQNQVILRQIERHLQDVTRLLQLLGLHSASGSFKPHGLTRDESMSIGRTCKGRAR